MTPQEFEQQYLPLEQPVSKVPGKKAERRPISVAPPPPSPAAQRPANILLPRVLLTNLKDLTEGTLKVYLVLCGLADEEGKVVDKTVNSIACAAGLCGRAVQVAVSYSERRRLINRSRADGKRRAYRIAVSYSALCVFKPRLPGRLQVG